MNLSCIGTVNDAVGGVTVEMDDDYTLYNAKFKRVRRYICREKRRRSLCREEISR